MGLRSGGFGGGDKKPGMGAPWEKKSMDGTSSPKEEVHKAEGKHIHVRAHGGNITSHSTDERGMEEENQHGSAEDAADHVRNFLAEGEQPSVNDNKPEPTRHFGLMA